MEFGARALGNRSLIADPRRTDMRDIINLRIKFREKFRPFAPSILEEHVGEWFEIDEPTPYMEKVFPIRPERRREIPAVTHVDGTGRLQTVSRKTNPLYHALISRFYERTGVPIVLNTSLNENEPVVRTPAEAISCFLRTDMDALVLGHCVIDRHREGFPEHLAKRPRRTGTALETCVQTNESLSLRIRGVTHHSHGKPLNWLPPFRPSGPHRLSEARAFQSRASAVAQFAVRTTGRMNSIDPGEPPATPLGGPMNSIITTTDDADRPDYVGLARSVKTDVERFILPNPSESYKLESVRGRCLDVTFSIHRRHLDCNGRNSCHSACSSLISSHAKLR